MTARHRSPNSSSLASAQTPAQTQQPDEWVERDGVLTRRQLIVGASALGGLALSGCYGDATYEVDRSIFTYWQDEAVRYEREGVYTMEDQGKWEGQDKEKAHTPSVEIYANNTAVISRVDHPMSAEHWVEAIYFKDQNGDVFYLEHFSYLDAKDEGKIAETYIAIPEGVTSVTAYAFCNLHGTWKSDVAVRG
jgi:desulfoferrodoxin (superoxide reductase-like protein)